MSVIANPPFPSYFDSDGSPLEDGYIYFGAANQNPETNPITVYWDSAYTQPALQPIRTSGGFTYRAGTPANIYVSTDFSITVRDKNRRLVYSKLLSEGQTTAEVNLQYSTQAITATAAQTVFGLSTAYTPGNNSLAVYHNGSRLIVGSDYTETSATVITLAIGATAGDVLQFVTATPINPSSLGAAAVAYVPAGAGAVATNVQAKLRERVSVKDFGAVGDGVTDDTAAIQAAIDSVSQATDVTLVNGGGAQTVGGGEVLFPPTDQGYKITSNINVTKKKIRLIGPAKLILSAGVTGFAFQYTGSNAHSGCVISGLDFIGGDVGVDIGDQAMPIPVGIYNCMFVNQASAGVRIGQYGYGTTICDSVFNNCNYGIWSYGQASDVLLVDHNVFQYSGSYDIYVQNNNTFRITNNDFVLNQKSPVSSQANIYVDTTTSSETGGYSVISQNKFGPEGRTGGNCIVFSGISGAVVSVVIRNNTFHYFSQATTNYAIKVSNKAMRGWTVADNSLVLCSIVDGSSVTTNAFTRDNLIENNASIFGNSGYSQILRSGFQYVDSIEPQPWDKLNILAWSRFINSGADFTYSNATPSYMTAVDENGIANNATTAIATSASNYIRINQLNTNNQQRFYAFTVWIKLDVAGDVRIQANRSTNYAFDQTFTVGTSYQRIAIEFYQTYYASGNPYVVDITIPNGATITLGGVCCVPGRDVGDLFKTNQVTERYGLGMFASASPSVAMYSPAGRRVFNSAPAVGSPKGWVCTVAGAPGTWVSEGNL
jgi:hypothetical protein